MIFICVHCCACAVCVCECVCVCCALGRTRLFVSGFTCCCSGLARCIYFKVVQGECRRFSSACKCQILKMQRVYMHSHEHFEVFTTVLAPQGESYHICRRVWRSMTLRAGECKVTWHSEIMNHLCFVIADRLLLHWKAGWLCNCCPCILCEEILMRLCINNFFFFLLIHFSLTGSQEGIDSGQRLRRQVKPALLFI